MPRIDVLNALLGKGGFLYDYPYKQVRRICQEPLPARQDIGHRREQSRQ
nr:hypothetical protein [Vulcanisaeta sp. JCM 14467]